MLGRLFQSKGPKNEIAPAVDILGIITLSMSVTYIIINCPEFCSVEGNHPIEHYNNLALSS